jgi:hypothetical protein
MLPLAAPLLPATATRGQEAAPAAETSAPPEAAAGQEGEAPDGHDAPEPRQARPIAEVVEQVVSEIEARRRASCREADAKGVPCFPISAESREERRARLNRALGRLRKENADVGRGHPGPDPLGLPIPRPSPSLAQVSFDPVCAVKSLLKSAQGRNQHYFLYRVKGVMGESIALRETRLEPAGGRSRAPLEFTLLGEYDGECEALAAHAKALRELFAEQHPADAEPLGRPPTARAPQGEQPKESRPLEVKVSD